MDREKGGATAGNESRKLRFFYVLTGFAAFCAVVFIFRFERKTVLFDNPFSLKPGADQVSTNRLGQMFRIVGSFNAIDLGLFNPGAEDVPCEVLLKDRDNGRILVQKTLIIARKTGQENRHRLILPDLKTTRNKTFLLEVNSSARPFVVLASRRPIEKGGFRTYIHGRETDTSLVFTVQNDTRISLFGYLLRFADHRTRTIGGLFVLLGFLLIGFLGYLLLFRPGSVQRSSSPRFPGLTVLSVFAALLFIVAALSYLVANNVHSKFLGAEDDAFITYRYAHNISDGLGFVFNPGERVLGTSTPLYTLILSAFGLVWKNFPAWSLILNFVAIFLSSVLVYRLLSEKMPETLALAGGIVFLYFPPFYRVLGMETNCVIALLLASIFAYSRRRYPLAFFIAGLASLTRMECVLLAGVLGLDLLRRRAFRPLFRSVAAYVLTVLPWFVFSVLYFGRPFPNTLYTKTQAGHPDGIFGNVPGAIGDLITLRLGKIYFLSGFAAYLRDNIQYYLVWVALFALFVVLGSRRAFRHWLIQAYALWVGLYVLAYAIIQPPRFIWYYILPLALVPMIIAAGIDALHGWVGRKRGAVAAAAASMAVIAGLFVFELRSDHELFFGHWVSRGSAYLERYETYAGIAGHVRTAVPENRSIAMEEIGILGYHVPNRIWDLYLLIHDNKTGTTPPHLSDTPDRIPFYLTLMDPDYVLLNIFRYLSAPSFENYEIEAEYPVPRFPPRGALSYVLLKRKDGAMPVLGAIRFPEQLRGRTELEGWAIGLEELTEIELRINGRQVPVAASFESSPADLLRMFGSSPYAGRAAFRLTFDAAGFENGAYDVEGWARGRTRSGIFLRRRLLIEN